MRKPSTTSNPVSGEAEREPLRARGTDRLLDILDFFVNHDEPMTRNAIAVAVDAPRSTIYALIEQLIERGYLEYDHDSSLISLGPRISQLSNRQMRFGHFERTVRRHIEQLASKLTVVAEINVIENWQQLVLFCATGNSHGYLNAVEGARYPLPWTASARFLLEGLSENELIHHLSAADFSIPGNGKSLTPAQLVSDMQAAKKRGYELALGWINPYIGCVSAPLRNREGQCVAAISMVMPLSQLEAGQAKLVDAILKTAAELNNLLKTMDEFPWSQPEGIMKYRAES